MPLSNSQLRELADTAGAALQQIQDALGQSPNPYGKVQFPRRFIRPAGVWAARYWYVPDTVRRNLGYAHQTLDVFRWLILRTDLFSIARDMVYKELVCLVASICEALCDVTTKGAIGRHHKFKTRTRRMVENEMITAATKDNLDWLWDQRGAVHISLLPNSEIDRYDVNMVARASGTLETLHAELDRSENDRLSF